MFNIYLLLIFSLSTSFAQAQSEEASVGLVEKSWKHANPLKPETVTEVSGNWEMISQVDGSQRLVTTGLHQSMQVTVGEVIVPAYTHEVSIADEFTGKIKTKTVKEDEVRYPGSIILNTDFTTDAKILFIYKRHSMTFTEKAVFDYVRNCRFAPADQHLYCRLSNDYEDDQYEVYRKVEAISSASGAEKISVKSYPQILRDTTVAKAPMAGGKNISVSDSHVFLTPENWITSKQGAAVGTIETSSPGAYLKIGFTGTSFGMTVDTSSLIASPEEVAALIALQAKRKKKKHPSEDESSGDTGNFEPDSKTAEATVMTVGELPKIGYQIDHGPIYWRVVPKSAVVVPLVLASGLSSGNHQIKISLEGLGNRDRWFMASDHLKISGFTLDADAQTIAPELLPKRMVVYGDSTSEGDNIYNMFNVVQNKQWSETWDARLADRLNAEVSVIAYQAQGFEQDGEGNVPNFIESYEFIRSSVYRDFSNPDYVFLLAGTNGVMGDSDLTQLGRRLRAAYSQAMIVVGVPFNSARMSLIQEQYVKLAKTDENILLFNLRDGGQKLSIDHSYDGVHPDSIGHKIAADLIYRQLHRYFQ